MRLGSDPGSFEVALAISVWLPAQLPSGWEAPGRRHTHRPPLQLNYFFLWSKLDIVKFLCQLFQAKFLRVVGAPRQIETKTRTKKVYTIDLGFFMIDNHLSY